MVRGRNGGLKVRRKSDKLTVSVRTPRARSEPYEFLGNGESTHVFDRQRSNIIFPRRTWVLKYGRTSMVDRHENISVKVNDFTLARQHSPTSNPPVCRRSCVFPASCSNVPDREASEARASEQTATCSPPKNKRNTCEERNARRGKGCREKHGWGRLGLLFPHRKT